MNTRQGSELCAEPNDGSAPPHGEKEAQDKSEDGGAALAHSQTCSRLAYRCRALRLAGLHHETEAQGKPFDVQTTRCWSISPTSTPSLSGDHYA